MTGRIWRQDLTLRSPAERTSGITGVVTDTSGVNLADATVTIVGTPFSTRTNADGSFHLWDLPPGSMRVSVQHLGYEMQRRDLELGEEDVVDMLPVQLADAATVLDPVSVMGTQPVTRRDLTEFERRRETTNGTFITREEFEEQGHVDETVDVLRRMQGIFIRPGTGFPEWIITTRRGASRGGLMDPSTNFCYPLVFIDHNYAGTTGDIDVNRGIPISAVEAIEVYASAAGVPQEFNRAGSVCGVIVFWTR
jgi:hypothetical protein